MAKAKKKKKAVKRKRLPPIPQPISSVGDHSLSRVMERALDLTLTQVRRAQGTRAIVTLQSRVPPAPVGLDTGRSHHARKVYYRSPWALVAKFTFRAPITYRTLYHILSSWDRSDRLHRDINDDRGTRINVGWAGSRGERDEFTLSGPGPWDGVLSESLDRLDPNNKKGLVAIYEGKRGADITSMTVWLSEGSWQEYVWV